ncbi:hypothetical protein KIPB_005844 [Kipferlia bialata]|uniref:Uncharacterized protein n=1 Tax=Kipferlia bialata TaxID=797122 RepID=A0A9K3CXZ2_9EUKA|nr:hypothetical protein KIPB_004565 [Kipferlia bialata]GIQ84368.1 hypothetical protein KIPB_005844 [Kipferlia bialata]|eukprot:g4565.t1
MPGLEALIDVCSLTRVVESLPATFWFIGWCTVTSTIVAITLSVSWSLARFGSSPYFSSVCRTMLRTMLLGVAGVCALWCLWRVMFPNDHPTCQGSQDITPVALRLWVALDTSVRAATVLSEGLLSDPDPHPSDVSCVVGYSDLFPPDALLSVTETLLIWGSVPQYQSIGIHMLLIGRTAECLVCVWLNVLWLLDWGPALSLCAALPSLVTLCRVLLVSPAALHASLPLLYLEVRQAVAGAPTASWVQVCVLGVNVGACLRAMGAAGVRVVSVAVGDAAPEVGGGVGYAVVRGVWASLVAMVTKGGKAAPHGPGDIPSLPTDSTHSDGGGEGDGDVGDVGDVGDALEDSLCDTSDTDTWSGIDQETTEED